MDKEVYDEEDVAIGRQRPLVWRVDFPVAKTSERVPNPRKKHWHRPPFTPHLDYIGKQGGRVSNE
jgi:hypothetical protein